MKRIVFFAGVFIVLTSCSMIPKPATMSYELPRETDVPGWVIDQQHSLNSVKKIELMSPNSSEYEPVEMVTADYHYLSDSTRTVTVRIFRFRTSMDAFGLYSRVRGFDPNAQFANDDTYSCERGLFSRQGKFYVSVSGGPEGERDPAILQQFLLVVRQNLKSQAGAEGLPDYVLSLSVRGSSRDVIYYKAGLDSIPGARDLFVTRRSISGKNYDLVYSRLPSAFDAEQTFHRVLKAGGGTFMLTKIGTIQPAIKIVAPAEYLFISYYKQWIFGVLNAENMKEVNKIIIYLYGDVRVRAGKKVNNASER